MMNTIETAISSLLRALSSVRTPAQPEEYDIHAAIASALTEAGLCYEHEYKLGPRCRIDFRVERVGIEVKKGRPAVAALTRQLRRYMASEALDAVVVVTQRAVQLPDTIAGKPLYQVSLNRLWGVALP